ncbi:MAG: hypothetical protein JW943_00395 [Deltaproteobacteria bacterium]|nr:hypothetical protein [Deltaproteobacteria bacterium]
MTDRINVNALFLGPKSENYAFFKQMLNYLMDDHAQWRRYFHPDDALVVTEEEQGRPDFTDTLQRTYELYWDNFMQAMARAVGRVCEKRDSVS